MNINCRGAALTRPIAIAPKNNQNENRTPTLLLEISTRCNIAFNFRLLRVWKK